MRRRFLLPPLAICAVAALVGACAAGADPTGFHGTGAGTGGSASSASSNGGGSTLTGLGASSTGGGGTGGGVSSAYAHTNDTLFKLDPSQPNLALSQIGKFDCLGGSGQDSSMTDLAVDSAGDVWGISSHNVYKLDLPAGGTGTVHCAQTIPLNNSKGVTFYGLSFAPAGLLDPSAEVLVAGNTAGELWAIDTGGNLTQHGTFGTVPTSDGHGHTYKNAGKEWELSGDIVFLADNGNPIAFATVRDCPTPPSSSSCDSTDTLIELDLDLFKTAGSQVVTKSVRGAVVKSATCNDTKNQSYGGMYGIAAYQDKVFGFSHSGFIVTIDNNDGSACLALDTSSDLWAGAAITTVAPVVPPTQ